MYIVNKNLSVIIKSIAIIALALTLQIQPVLAGIVPKYSTSIGMTDWTTGILDSPTGVALDSAGNIYVVDDQTDRVQKFSPAGEYLMQWGTYGTGDGQLKSPGGIAIDASDNVYIADSSNDRIQKFTSDGTYILQWGIYGTADGQFKHPVGVSIDNLGNVLVVEYAGHRVQKFTPTGTFILKFGTYSSTNHNMGYFSYPRGITSDATGNIYVADTNKNRVQIFNTSGTAIGQIGNVPTSGTADGYFNKPTGVAVDAAGNIYVADRYNNRIQKFNSSRTFVSKWGQSGKLDGDMISPYGLVIDDSGNLLVAEQSNYRVQTFTTTGAYVSKFGKASLDSPNGVAVDASDNIYVADSDNFRLLKFNANREFISEWSVAEGNRATNIALDSLGNMYVLSEDYGVYKYSPTGVFITKWGGVGTGDGLFGWPMGIATDSSDNVYVADSDNNRIQKFDSNGNYLTQWGALGAEDGQFDYPTSVYVDASNTVYIADLANSRVQKFNANGLFLGKWGSNGNDNGQFIGIHGITGDSAGNIYIVDNTADRMQKFTSEGVFLAQWGWDDDMYAPHDIAVNSEGTVYVADTVNCRIAVFTQTVTAPIITLTDVYLIGSNSATFSVDIADGGEVLTERGIVYSTTSNPPTVDDTKVVVPGTSYNFEKVITGLTPSTQYYYRAFATNSLGTSYGELDWIVTTIPAPSSIITSAIPYRFSVTVVGSMALNDSGPTTGSGLVYSTTRTSPTIVSDTVVPQSISEGNITRSIGGLTPNTLYYVRFYFTNANGTTYSNTMSVTTLSNDFEVTIDATPTFLKTTSANLTGYVVGDGGNDITERGFVYSTSNAVPTVDDTKVTASGTTDDVWGYLANLTANTHYYFRGFATNGTGTVYSNTGEFTTLNATAPIVNGGLYTVISANGDTPDHLQKLNQSTFTVENSTQMTLAGQIINGAYGIAQSPTTGDVYAIIDVDAEPNPIAHLVKVNLETAVLTDIGEIKDSVGSTKINIAGISFRSNGTLYAVTGDGNGALGETLFTLELTTAVATLVMPLGNGTDGEAIGFAADGYLYHFSGWDSSIPNTNVVFEKINIDTQVITNIPLTGFSEDITNIFSLSYIGNDEFLIAGYPLWDSAGALWTLNKSGMKSVPHLTGIQDYKGILQSIPRASAPTATSTTVFADVASDGGAAVTERGVVYSTSNSTPTISDTKVVVAGTTGGLTAELTGLNGGTTYYFRAFATNSAGTSYSATASFTTTASIPTVTTTSPATAVTKTTATVAGTVTSDSGATVTERGVVYSTTNNPPTTADSKQIVAGTTGALTANITGLTETTTYHSRAYAINEHGTAYGDVVSFTTTAYEVPTVTTTSPATSITATSATVSGVISSDGGTVITERGIVYSSSNNTPTTETRLTVSGTTGSLSRSITGLTASTTYYARAYATNAEGTAYGDVVTFTTTANGSLIVTTTSPATSIAITSATVSGTISSDGGAEITERGVLYSSVNNQPTLSDSKKVVTGTTGALSASLTGLTANTTYYARVYATNSEGTTYGNVITFKTLTAIPTTLQNVYFTFGKLLYGRYAAPSQMRSGDNIYLKNYDPKKVKLLAISLYDYNTKGNQCYSRTWKSSTQMYMKTCGLLPAKRKYAFIFTFQDIATRTIIKKYFVVNTISSSTITY
jgi:uncharacterized protein YjiK